MNRATTPAFMPLDAKKASANAAGQRHERGSWTLRPSARSSQGSSAYGSSTGVVAPATTTYGLTT